MNEVKLPFRVVEQLQARSRVAARNTAERAAANADFDLARTLARETSAALVKAVFRATKLAVETIEAHARAATCENSRASLLAAAAALAEGSHFNGATLLGTGRAEIEKESDK